MTRKLFTHHLILRVAGLCCIVAALGGDLTVVSSSASMPERSLRSRDGLTHGSRDLLADTNVYTGTTAVTEAVRYEPAGEMRTPHTWHSATRLQSGRVLLVGGDSYGAGDSGLLFSAEIYDSATGGFAGTGSTKVPHGPYHTATLLPDGTVLIVGGQTHPDLCAHAEIYDPSTGTFRYTLGSGGCRDGHTATLLSDGTVLVAGGSDGNSYLASAELYDPATETFESTGDMAVSRSGHTATRLLDGRILIVGGGQNSTSPTSAEIYDPIARHFVPTGSTSEKRGHGGSLLLRDGRVLVAGGSNISTAEIYDPRTGRFTPTTGSMQGGGTLPQLTLLDNGKVLVSGGTGLGGNTALTEFFDPATGLFSPAGTMSVFRYRHTATLLDSGQVLMAGGVYQQGSWYYLSSAERGTWMPPNTFTATLVAPSDWITAGTAELASRICIRSPSRRRFAGKSRRNLECLGGGIQQRHQHDGVASRQRLPR